MDKRRAKIVATLGPNSENVEMLEKMILAGINIARLNFSHGTHDIHRETADNIRNLSKKLNKPIAVMQDLQGVKIRTGILEPRQLSIGDTIILSTESKPEPGYIPVDFPELHKCLQPGKRILLDDGNLELLVEKVENKTITTTVLLGGLLKSHKGINLPGTSLDIPGFTSKDEEDLNFGLEIGVDAVAVSFVRSADDIIKVRKAASKRVGSEKVPIIIAKLERPEALDNLDEIIAVSDGVMVARGDLAVEMSPEIVPIEQKRIIEKANLQRKLVITATQMLDSMIHNPRPTRAEATDVANAIFDGTDAVMLSGETAIGEYPIETIEMMNAIICESEDNLKKWGRWHGTPSENHADDAIAISNAARELAHDLNVSAVVVFTQSGRTARLMSKAMPRVPIIGFTPYENTYQRMAFYWGVNPIKIPFAKTMEDMLQHVETAMLSSSHFQPHQQVVVICGFPVGDHRATNLALLHEIGNY